ncbi:helix-turn-helix domain-containing protein [Halobacillus karajensis]|uniref:Cytoskeletal protein RodZ n=2 Tax=Halobacillus karajensis TaxID=195088 RepID=A0A024P2J1_9BACI|nr:RodZ family helix-turn-helix domain-containing protein [Halobacillus karajensis]CDQ19676.1 cytoskeletal protein RodZ [Halobacillus karajensis]CDQ22136.1 cytoskeletal protein RodZ [Halobacillus karajensis]CDQ27977.1 cytoskeletal protein RodZ [Halobacillus karajensis]
MEIGARLKEARESKGLSLETLQETTKIQKRYLQAIEKNEFQVLPGKFYTRAFIREYASAVGLDPEQVMEEHKAELPTFDEENTVQYSRVQRTKKEATQKSSRSSRILPTILTVGLIIGLIFVIWVVWQNMSGTDQESGESDNNSNDEINVPAESEEEASNDQEQADSANDTTEEETDPAEGEEDSTEDTTEEVKMELTQEGAGSFPEHEYQITGASDPKVTIELTGTAYLEVQAPKGGESLITSKEYTADDSPISLDLGESDEVFIKTGNAPGTTVKVGDQEVSYPNPELSTQKLWLQFN